MELRNLSITIPDLVHYARTERSLALPDFQRPYEWDVDRVAEMLRTIFKDWPSGSILVLGKGPRLEEFAVRPLEGAPDIVDTSSVSTLVLDGQQRLTPVFQAVTDTAAEVTYYVDMERVMSLGGFDDDCVKYVKSEDFPNVADAATQMVVGVHQLYEKTEFDKWREYLKPEASEEVEHLFDHHLSSIRRYKFPTNELDATISFPVLVGIFDRLNRQGEPLKTFDLLVARLLAEKFDLRERWAEAQKLFPDFETLRIDGVDIIKLIALETHLEQRRKKEDAEAAGKQFKFTVGGIRDENVLELPPALIGERWEIAVERFSDAITFLQERAGCVHRSLMPQKALVTALAHALSLSEKRAGFRDDLEVWVWTAYFTQSYAQGANTQAVADAVALAEWNKSALAVPSVLPNLKPTDVAAFRHDRDGLRAALTESRRRNTSLLRGLMALLIQHGARDWKKGKGDDILRNYAGAFDFHHIFPEDFLRVRDIPSDVVLNFTPLKSGTNRSIGKDAPSTLFDRQDISFDAIPTHRVELDQLREDDWQGFRESRIDALMNLVEHAAPTS